MNDKNREVCYCGEYVDEHSQISNHQPVVQRDITMNDKATAIKLYVDARCLQLRDNSPDNCNDAVDALAKLHEAFDEPDTCGHKFVHLNTKKKDTYNGFTTAFVRIDRYFCEKCLEEKEVRKTDYSRDTPDWY